MNGVSIRILDETKDRSILETAWNWSQGAPNWFKNALAVHKETLKDFLHESANELIIGIFIDNEPQSVVRFVPMANGLYELHLMAKRKTDFNILLQACESIKQYVFDNGIKRLGGWIPARNRHIVRLYKLLGFNQRGQIVREGTFHGRDIVWVYFEKSNVD